MNIVKEDEYIKDKILEKWSYNYSENYKNGIFSSNRSRPLSLLYNTAPYHKLPIVLIAAGPSLDKNIHILKKYQKNVIIFCADVVVYRLLEEDIKPDIVCSIDPSNMFVRFWEDLDTSDLTLICPTTIHPECSEAWKGRFLFFNQEDHSGSEKDKLLKKLTKPTRNFGYIFNRFFVGATQYQIAEIFKPYPAILLGYDFGYTDNKAYCSGFLDRKIIDIDNPEGSEAHKQAIERMKAEQISNEMKVNVDGQAISTTKLLYFYKNTILGLIKKYRVPTINATEGGILTEIERYPLQKVIDDLCKNEIEKKDLFDIPKRKRRKKK